MVGFSRLGPNPKSSLWAQMSNLDHAKSYDNECNWDSRKEYKQLYILDGWIKMQVRATSDRSGTCHVGPRRHACQAGPAHHVHVVTVVLQ